MLPFPIFVAPFYEFIIINASFKLTIIQFTFSLKINFNTWLILVSIQTNIFGLHVLLLSMYFLVVHINLFK